MFPKKQIIFQFDKLALISPVAKKRMTKTTKTMGRTMLARWKQILMFLFCLLVITDTLHKNAQSVRRELLNGKRSRKAKPWCLELENRE